MDIFDFKEVDFHLRKKKLLFFYNSLTTINVSSLQIPLLDQCWMKFCGK